MVINKNNLLSESLPIVQVHDDMWIYLHEETYHVLVKNSQVLGFVKLSPIEILKNNYNHIDLIYIFKEHRNSKAFLWLIFYLKEYKSPLMADDAIFADGQRNIQKFNNHQHGKVSILNKSTGEISPYKELVNDSNLCYIFTKSLREGFGKQYWPNGGEFTWYPIFE